MYQQLTIVGNLGADPEMRYTQEGTPVTTFSVAVNKRVKGQEQVTWFRVSAWRELAELCNQYLAKGRPVLVTGEVKASAWQKDGKPAATLEVTADRVRFLPGGSRQEGERTLEEEEALF